MRSRSPGAPPGTPGAARSRRAIERRSAAPLVFLRQMPAAVVPVVAVLLLIAGIAVRGPGGASALLILAVFLSWIGYLSWPSLDPRGRLLRIAALAVLVGFAAFQATR